MRKRASYWRRTQRLTALLIMLWLIITFGLTWFARELNEIIVFGFPFGFYLAAQGALLLYLAIIWWYNRTMKKLDIEFGVEEA